jgi:hypothetical protein
LGDIFFSLAVHRIGEGCHFFFSVLLVFDHTTFDVTHSEVIGPSFGSKDKEVSEVLGGRDDGLAGKFLSEFWGVEFFAEVIKEDETSLVFGEELF